MAELKDLVSELMSLNNENLSKRIINDNDVQWCLSELYDMLAVDLVEVVRCKDCKWHDSVDGPTAKIEQLQSELEQVKRERNEAISCLRYSGECYGCLYAIDDEPALCEACNESEENCNESCTWFGDPCGNCNQYEKDNWKWRGAKEDKQNETD